MNRIIRTLILATALLAAGAAAAGTPGEAGFLSLRMGVGAREVAMGGAGVAATHGAAGVYWNPAKLAFEDHGTDLLLQHQRSFGLFDREAAALAHRTGKGVIGLLFSGFYSDDMNRYSEDNVGVAEGTFNPYQVAVGVTYSRQVNERLALGVGVKLLHEEIDIYGGSGLAYDVFLAHKALVEGLWFGASVTNLGSDLTLDAVPYKLPTAARLGMSWEAQQGILANRLALTGDVIFPNDGNNKAHVGAEFHVAPALSLRMGSKINYESQGLTFGAGFRRGELEVDYAFEDMKNDLDPAHRFTVRFLFGNEG